MLERALIALLLVVGTVMVYRLVIAWQRQQVNRIKAANDEARRQIKAGRPAIVYFTTPGCVPCRTQQQPALVQIAEDLGHDVQIIQVDATEHPESADRWGVLSAPTTFVIDATGKTRSVNHGVATADRLRQQLAQL